MSDPSGQPTEEEIQAYLDQLRAAPVHDLLMQAFSVLGTGAEVKLGLPDARVLIDCMEAVISAAGSALEDAAPQLREAVAQLKLAQVQAERQMAGRAADGQQAAPGEQGAGQPAGGGTQAPPESEQRATDKLWIPGRDR